VPFGVMSYLVEIDEVNPDDGFLLKILDDLDWVGDHAVPDMEFHVIGPQYTEILSVVPLAWLAWTGHLIGRWSECNAWNVWLLMKEIFAPVSYSTLTEMAFCNLASKY
jgi:hypothetical protein